MAFVEIEPGYRELLTAQGLASAADFLRLEGVILCGHPDRHVAEVVLDGGQRAFLKREHRVRWRDRLASAWAGCGFVSKSLRELMLLRALRRTGVGCAEPLAAGEDGQGRAFLLLREVPGGRDLCGCLKDCRGSPRQRRALARHLGAALARLHAAGFDHPDLVAKHVLVSPGPEGGEPAFHFLDWQRSRHHARLSWAKRCRDLAALDATLADDLAGPRDRLACLRAYLSLALTSRDREGAVGRRPLLHGRGSLAATTVARRIRRISAALLRKQHIRELRQAPLRPATQNLIWLDGEALCVTLAFRLEMNDGVHADLRLPVQPEVVRHRVEQREITLPGARRGTLVRRSLSRPLRWLWTWLRRKALPSPELEQAGTLFRLQRYGIPTPRLLAVGQRHSRPWRTESFLLTETAPVATHLVAWLVEHVGRRQRRRLIRQAADILRRTHDAGYALPADAWDSVASLLLVQYLAAGPQVVLGDPGLLTRHAGRPPVVKDLKELRRVFGPLGTQTEALRFLLDYLDVQRLTPAARRLAWAVVGRAPRRVAA